MQRDLGFYLSELLQPIEYILRRAAAGSLERYQSDEDYRFAIERNLSMIGEVTAQLRRDFPAESKSIQNLPKIVAFRNIVIHDYWGLDQTEVWSIILTQLPVLQQDVRAALEQLPPA